MKLSLHLWRMVLVLGFLASTAATAQINCGPTGFNSFGAPCDPSQGGGGPASQSGPAAPMDATTSPTITNRSTLPGMGAARQQQQRGVPGSPQSRGQFDAARRDSLAASRPRNE